MERIAATQRTLLSWAVAAATVSSLTFAEEIILLPRPDGASGYSDPYVRRAGFGGPVPATREAMPPKPVFIPAPAYVPAMPVPIPQASRVPMVPASQHHVYQPIRPEPALDEPVTTAPTAYGEMLSNPAASAEAYCPNGECPVYYRRRPYGTRLQQAITILDNRAGEPEWYKKYRWCHYGYYPTRWAAWPCDWFACRGYIPEPHPYDREPPEANTRDLPDNRDDRLTEPRPGPRLPPTLPRDLPRLPGPEEPGRLPAPAPGPAPAPMPVPPPANSSNNQPTPPRPITPKPVPNLNDLIPPVDKP